MKTICFLILTTLSIFSCDKKAEEKAKNLESSARSEVGRIIETTKEVAADLELKAKEQAQAAAEAYEDAQIEVEAQMAEIGEEVDRAINP
jgi:hypothetical protein